MTIVVPEPTKVVPKFPKHPINAPVSQSIDMTHYPSKTTATNASTSLPTKAKKYNSKTLQADGRPLESSKSTAQQISTSKTSSNKRKRTSLALPSKDSTPKSSSVLKPVQSTVPHKISGRMSSLTPTPIEPDGLNDTDLSTDSMQIARLQKKGTITTKVVENSKTPTSLKRLQKLKDKAPVPTPSVADIANSKKPAFTTASSSPTRSLRRNPQPKKVIEVSTAPCYKRKKTDTLPLVSSISRPSGEVTSPSSDLDFVGITPTLPRLIPAVVDTSSKGYYDPLSGESPPGVDLVDSPRSPSPTPIDTETISSGELA